MKLRGNRLNKTLDRYLGIPLLWILARWNAIVFRTPACPRGRSVLAIQIGTIGDAVLTIPALNYLKRQGYRCAILGSKANEHVYRVAGYEVILFDLQTILKSPLTLLHLLAQLRKREFEYIIDFTPWLRLSAFVSGLLKKKSNWLIGFKSKGQHRSCIFDQTICHSASIHESENYLRLVQQIASDSGHRTVKDYAECIAKDKIYALANQNELKGKLGFEFDKTKYLVIHPWSAGYRGQDKEWPIENYIQLIESLPEELQVLITGTEEDRERSQIFDHHRRILNITGLTNLAETMALILNAQFVVTVNTGILHIASWVGKDIICLNGPAGEVRWGGLQMSKAQRIVHLNASVPCSPCLNLGFEFKCKKMFCMPTITLPMVRTAIEPLLIGKGLGPFWQGRPATEWVASPVIRTRTRAIRDVALSEVPKIAATLHQKVIASGFRPDCLVYLETGGRLLAGELSRHFDVGVVPLFIRRKGMNSKIRLAALLVRLPLWVKNGLRQWEVRQASHRIGHQRQIREMTRVNLRQKKVLIVDDAVDTGFSARTSRNWAIAMGANPEEIKIAAVTVTMELSEDLLDFSLYSQICRFPWSADSIERPAYQEIYNNLKLTPYPQRPSEPLLPTAEPQHSESLSLKR